MNDRALRSASPKATNSPANASVPRAKHSGGSPRSVGKETNLASLQVSVFESSESKLRIAADESPLELEARRVAAEVMQFPSAPVLPRHTPISGRKLAFNENATNTRILRSSTGAPPAQAPQIVDQVLSNSGRPLPVSTRNFFESRMGVDFSSVRIHDDAQAAQSAQAVRARAYTVGHSVVFGPSQFSPETTSGRALIAHELAHVAQNPTDLHREVATGEAPSAKEQARTEPPTAKEDLPESSFSVEERIGRLKELVSNLWTGLYDEAAILRILRTAPADQASQLIHRIDTERVDGKTLSKALDDSVDGDNNLAMHEQLSAIRLHAMGPEQGIAARQAAPTLPWSDQLFDDAVFFAEQTEDGRVRIKYPVRVRASDTFEAEVQALDIDHFTSGHLYDPDQVLQIHDYDTNRPAVTVVAREIVGYQHLGVRNFLSRTANIAMLAASPLTAARTVSGRIAVFALEKVVPTLSLLVLENKRKLVRWFPTWGPRIIRSMEIITWVVATYGAVALLRSGWRLIEELKQIRRTREAIRAAQGEIAEAEQLATKVERQADEVISQAESGRPAELGGKEADATIEKLSSSTPPNNASRADQPPTPTELERPFFDNPLAKEPINAVGSDTQTIWDLIKATQPAYSGTVIPRSFELATTNGRIWVAGNATEHLAEYALGLARRGRTPEYIRNVTQAQLRSLHAAVEVATKEGLVFRQMYHIDGWTLMFAAPQEPGHLPALIHALYGG